MERKETLREIGGGIGTLRISREGKRETVEGKIKERGEYVESEEECQIGMG